MALLGLTEQIYLLPGIVLVVTALYAVYQLFWSPLARFPGPNLAALTTWYEAYFQLVAGQGGQYIFEVQRMHQRYGPVVRVGPNELHFNDPDFYDSVYSQGAHIDKPEYTKHMFGSPGTVIAANDSELHKQRRSALNPFFSKRKILEQEHTIKRQVSKMCDRVAQEFMGTDNVLRLDYMLIAMSADMICDYVFDRSYSYLDAPGFTSPFAASLESLKQGAHTAVFLPWIPRTIRKLPGPWVLKLMPKIIPSIQLRLAMRKQIVDLKEEAARGLTRTKGTIMAEIVNTKMVPSEITTDRLTDEATGLVAAAVETTKTVTCAIIVHVLSNEAILKRLREELASVRTEDGSAPGVTVLEKLPYFNAVIEEGLRLGYGIVRRSPRIHKAETLFFDSKPIPPGTMLSASTYTMHHNETAFPDSHSFKPERWLDNPTGPDGKRPLTRYITSFNRGTRMCLGRQLAYAVMRVALAELFTRFELNLYDTGLKDVVCTCDYVAPGVAEGSKGVRATVRESRL